MEVWPVVRSKELLSTVKIAMCNKGGREVGRRLAFAGGNFSLTASNKV
jgi:hypothetical protein